MSFQSCSDQLLAPVTDATNGSQTAVDAATGSLTALSHPAASFQYPCFGLQPDLLLVANASATDCCD